MDLIVEEFELIKKSSRKKSYNFDLHKFRILAYYTKWKRGVADEKDREGFLKDIDKNTVRQRGLSRYMRTYIRKLMIPLYDGLKKIQFHDTLNGIIMSVYSRLHENYVKERIQRIETKIRVGDKL